MAEDNTPQEAPAQENNSGALQMMQEQIKNINDSQQAINKRLDSIANNMNISAQKQPEPQPQPAGEKEVNITSGDPALMKDVMATVNDLKLETELDRMSNQNLINETQREGVKEAIKSNPTLSTEDALNLVKGRELSAANAPTPPRSDIPNPQEVPAQGEQTVQDTTGVPDAQIRQRAREEMAGGKIPTSFGT